MRGAHTLDLAHRWRGLCVGAIPVGIMLHDGRVSMKSHGCLPKHINVCELTQDSAHGCLQQENVLSRRPTAVLLQQRDRVEACMASQDASAHMIATRLEVKVRVPKRLVSCTACRSGLVCFACRACAAQSFLKWLLDTAVLKPGFAGMLLRAYTQHTCSIVLQGPFPAAIWGQLRIVGKVADAQGSPVICPVGHAGHERQDCLNGPVGQVSYAEVSGEFGEPINSVHLCHTCPEPIDAQAYNCRHSISV